MAEGTMEVGKLDRRELIAMASRRGLVLGLAGTALPGLLAACSDDDGSGEATGPAGAAVDDDVEGTPVVGDLVDFALTSTEWAGAFGFATIRLHKGVVDGNDVYFIRTDVSDETFAKREKLIFVPKLRPLSNAGLSGAAYLFADAPDQPTVLSSEPGRPDYTPAWRLHNVSFKGAPRKLASVREIDAAAAKGDVSVQDTGIVMNGAIVKWSSGEMPVDDERIEYLGPGQLLEPPDTSGLTGMFKLHECFPGVRYIVCDTSLEPMAEGMNIATSPRLTGSSKARATGRTNVFMNGVEGSGPMGFQPSVFDSQVGDKKWSPYWDHMTYAWKKSASPRVLKTEQEVHAARDDGELEEFPGTPDTKGEIFTVNCPVLVLAPNTFTG